MTHVLARNPRITDQHIADLQGDATVQIIDAIDETALDAYYDLAQTPEVKALWNTAQQSFARESAKSMQRRLTQTAMEAFGSAAMAKHLIPAVMFRLCTKSCTLNALDHNPRQVTGSKPGRARQ